MPALKTSFTYAELNSKISEAEKTTKTVTICLANRLVMRVIGKQRNKYWYFRNPISMKLDRIGSYPEMTMAMASKRCMYLLNPHLDPQNKKKEILFGQVATDWLKLKKDRARYANIRKSVDYLKPLFNIPVKEIRNLQVKKTLLEDQVITPYKLQECLSCLCNIMDLAVENEYLDHNPCEVLKKSEAFPKHELYMSYKFVPVDEFSNLFTRICNLSSFWQHYFLMQCLLCVRPGECRQLQRDYLDEKNRIVSIPGSIMKVKRATPFRVPVNDAIIKLWHIIENECAKSKWLFPKASLRSPISEVDLSQKLKAVCDGIAHPHGFRKSARSFFASKGVPLEVAAMCLDHHLNTGADSVYQKSDLLDLRRPVIDKWVDEVKKHLPEELKMCLSVK